ncbi:MAG: TIR domain-containing protein [Alphaproteobacteria bacterium]|nr:TIR domain-containing protein [Alphaproteobacteria bacterium]
MPSNHQSGSVGVVFDALHGNINLTDFHPDHAGQAEKVASSPFMKRLQRIKQLGFVSQNFLSAQHNRYAHALGTAHIMRRLVERVEAARLFDNALPPVQALTGNDRFASSLPKAPDYLKQHMLIAALIQDVGELPYETASAGLFRPGGTIHSVLANADVDLNQMADKHQFTLYHVWVDHFFKEYFKGLDRTLLTYLISGLVPKGKTEAGEIACLRQMLDGKGIDADRIDYVFRDAFHTIGVHHMPDALIDSISTYDKDGTIVSRVRPVVDFIVTRATLWSNVYLSPENRFWTILLKRALTELSGKEPAKFKEYFGFAAGEITPENFLDLNDVLIDNAVHRMNRDALNIDRGPAALLDDGASNYDYRWVGLSKTPDPDWKGSIVLPGEFYWDTYADYRARDHSLYENGSVRVEGERYALISDRVEFEKCIGPFSAMLEQAKLPAFPMPEHMAWFAPREAWLSHEPHWQNLLKFKDAGQLTSQLEQRDPIGGVTLVSDTRGVPGFKPPAIFLAFSWQDKEHVDRLAGILSEHKRQYFVLTDGGVGLGHSPAENSKKAVDEAGAVILLASTSYLQTYSDRPDEGIHAEVSRMEARKDDIPIVPLALDDYAELNKIKSFPWKSISADGQRQYTGSGARHVASDEFRRRVVSALDYIDSFKARGP